MPRWRTPVVFALLLGGCYFPAGGKDTAQEGTAADDSGTPAPVDADGDGYTDDVDCDDTVATVHPDAQEVCDDADVDEDCDGLADSDDPDLADGVAAFVDADGDGFGDPEAPTTACELGQGFVADDTDCDDADAAVNPDADEVCDAADTDEDCSGAADNADGAAVDMTLFYADADGDGLGDPNTTLLACDEGAGVTADATDCDDGDATVGGPGTWYADADADGYGDAGSPVTSCDAVIGYVADATDCDDTNALANPAGRETCETGDEDCDGLQEDDDPSVDLATADTWYTDADGDGWGDADSPIVACYAPGGALDAGDCDDAEPTVNPGATELCDNGVDDDCDGGANTCGVATSTLSSTSADAMAEGENSGDYAGYTVAFVGDQDGDGTDDLLVAATREDSGGTLSGAVYVVGGGSTGAFDLGTADAKLDGPSSSAFLGTGAAGAGDLDGDGTPELVVGAWGYGSSAGAVYFVYGPVSGTDDVASAAGGYVVGAASYDECGAAVAGGRDATGDGRDDAIFACPTENSNGTDSGSVYVVSAAPSGGATTITASTVELQGDAANAGAGTSLALAEDVDGDGYDEVLVGAPDENAAFVVLGPVTSGMSLAAADVALDGAMGDFGSAVAGLGDTDGDGYGDVAVSRTNLYSVGLYSGNVLLYTGGADAIVDTRYVLLSGTPALSSYEEGASLAAAGDANDDGYADLVVGGPEYTSAGDSYGAAWLVTGPVSAGADLEDYARLRGDVDGDEAGWSVAGGGDFDGDGIDDVAVGAPGESTGGTDAGAAYVLFGGGL